MSLLPDLRFYPLGRINQPSPPTPRQDQHALGSVPVDVARRVQLLAFRAGIVPVQLSDV